MKKRILVGKIIGFIGICIFAMGITYVITHYLEKNKYADVNLVVTFEDSKEFTLENIKKLSKEEALKTYPYIFTIDNSGLGKVDFAIKIDDFLSDNLKREDLNYIILVNDKELASGSLSDIKDNILIENSISKKTSDIYKIYIYLNKEIDNVNYSYSLAVETR